MRGVTTWQELRTYWSLDEVLDALEALEIQDEADWLASQAKGKS